MGVSGSVTSDSDSGGFASGGSDFSSNVGGGGTGFASGGTYVGGETGGYVGTGGTDSVGGVGGVGGTDSVGGTHSVGGIGGGGNVRFPPSECTVDTECPMDEICYAGVQCQEGCSDPSCCIGNVCSMPGCGASRPPLCLAFGCSDGWACLATCDATRCECDGVSWVCESTTGGAPVASCPQACAPP